MFTYFLKLITHQTDTSLAIAIIATSVAMAGGGTSNKIFDKNAFHVTRVAPTIKGASRILAGEPIESFGAFASLNTLGNEIGVALHKDCGIHVYAVQAKMIKMQGIYQCDSFYNL